MHGDKLNGIFRDVGSPLSHPALLFPIALQVAYKRLQSRHPVGPRPLGLLLDLIELEVRELLSKYQFDGDNVPIIRGAAVKALNGEKGALAEEAILKLFAALDGYIQLPERAKDRPFLMPIEGVHSISGRGTVVTGLIERGIVKIGDPVEIVGLGDTRSTVVISVETYQKILDRGEAGDNVGCLLRGIDRDAVQRGQVLTRPGTVKSHRKFDAEVYVLTKEEGGRHTPFFGNYRPQFYFRTTDVTGTVGLKKGAEMVLPGDNAELSVELHKPVAIEGKSRFAIREGNKTVGAGIVTRIVE